MPIGKLSSGLAGGLLLTGPLGINLDLLRISSMASIGAAGQIGGIVVAIGSNL